ncbi:MAG: 2-amino-4-hydroxy-6-hydroxymethyldihydropteridine diphosphokinase [bacterium]
METKKVFISFGSNIGDKNDYIRRALLLVCSSSNTSLISCSSLMTTSPVGVNGQDDYINQVAIISTNIKPLQLIKEFKSIEAKLGRKQRARWSEREIDIDIVIYEGVLMNDKELVIPHKELLNRLFLLKGCLDLEPEYVVEGLGITLKELYFNNIDRLKGQSVVQALTS